MIGTGQTYPPVSQWKLRFPFNSPVLRVDNLRSNLSTPKATFRVSGSTCDARSHEGKDGRDTLYGLDTQFFSS